MEHTNPPAQSTTQPAVTGGVRGRLAAAGRSLVLATAQRWAWSTLAVPLAVAIIAVAAFLVARSGSHPRVSAALDSLLITATHILDPENVDGAGKYLPMRRLLHGALDRLSRGALARRRDAGPLIETAAEGTPA